ncbi:isoliquiritigenin 2'-O-methyltransferase-like [Abrus precatorius]|uniref:Isoliquiritigenin 2'-O-methyltransferase-like n=1 Tax=Abrus precatorius TaxID=3816 RepID=A0A8B8LZI5_ABRPR|nr:isoliquiritigenin 2'-O-methyltransferase-like [Abrus precatorius]
MTGTLLLCLNIRATSKVKLQQLNQIRKTESQRLVKMSSDSKQNKPPTEVAKVDDAYLSALVLCFSRVFPAILNAAIDLNLFDIIAKGQRSRDSSMSASEIASLFPNPHPELAKRLDRILPLLASYSLLSCSIRTNEDGKRERVYLLSPVGEYFARVHDGSSLSPLSTLIHRGYHDVWKNVKDAILDPNCNVHFESVLGMSAYQYMESNEEINKIFYEAMTYAGPLDVKRVLEIYKGFEGVSTLVDVGGSTGQALKQILSVYPSIKGINFDLPQMIQGATPLPGIEHVGGDMFESVPQGDAILLKLVCHNWPDEDCIKFLRNCHKALPPHGKVIVLDFIMPEVPNSSNISKHTCAIDNLMFLVHGGKERTENEFRNLCMSSGFSKFHIASSDVTAMSGVMEFYK